MSWSQRLRGHLIADTYRPWMAGATRILDVGCGNAVVSTVIANALGVEILGTDIADYRKHPIPFTRMAEPSRLPFPDRSFDVVMFNDVLHHSDHCEALLAEGARLAGRLLVFEDIETRFLRGLDVTLNHFYHAAMRQASFRSPDRWKSTFSGLQLAWEEGIIRHPWWYPVRHVAFRLAHAGPPETRQPQD